MRESLFINHSFLETCLDRANVILQRHDYGPFVHSPLSEKPCFVLAGITPRPHVAMGIEYSSSCVVSGMLAITLLLLLLLHLFNNEE